MKILVFIDIPDGEFCTGCNHSYKLRTGVVCGVFDIKLTGDKDKDGEIKNYRKYIDCLRWAKGEAEKIPNPNGA